MTQTPIHNKEREIPGRIQVFHRTLEFSSPSYLKRERRESL